MAKKPNPFMDKFEASAKDKKQDAKGAKQMERAAKTKDKGKKK